MKKYTAPKTSQDWLKLAVSKEKHQEVLQEVHGNIASDGIVMFRDGSLPDGVLPGYDFLPILEGARDNHNAGVVVDRDSFILALRQVGTMAPKSSLIRLYVDGCMYFHSDGDDGESTVTIKDGFEQCTNHGRGVKYVTSHYHHAGENILLAVNYDYLARAACGMGDTLRIALKSPTSPIYMTDGTKEAVIMPMKLDN